MADRGLDHRNRDRRHDTPRRARPLRDRLRVIAILPIVAVYLVRHASAGTRNDRDPHDHARALDGKGRRQAHAIAALLADRTVVWIGSSPSRRCIETVGPLATATGIEIEEIPDLAEGTSIEESWAVLAKAASLDGDAVLCSHGDVIPELIHRAQTRGMEIRGKAGASKGSVWKLAGWRDDRFRTGTYTHAP